MHLCIHCPLSNLLVIITGDFNIDIADNLNIQTQTLNNIYKAYNLAQLINKPTRIDKKSGIATTIDHIWVNKDMNLINKSGTFIGVSDHFGTYLKVNMKKLEATKEEVYYRCYKNYSASASNEDLERNLHNSRVNNYIADENVNAATKELIKVLQDTAELHAPMRKIHIGTTTKISSMVQQ